MRAWTLATVVAASAALPALAQAPPEDRPTGEDTIRAIIEQELEPPPGGYTYNPQGRRDPFVSLVKGVTGEGGASRKGKAGMEAFLIQEVALKGIVKTPEGFIGMFLGTDGKSYFSRVGQRLFDGQIVTMDQQSVTFRQEVTDPLSPVRTRDLKKSLYPSEEMRQ